MAYRSPNQAYMRRNTIRRQISAKDDVQAQNQPPTPPPPPPPEKEERVKPKGSTPQKNPSQGRKNMLSGLFSDGKLDNDKIIIIALIVILAKEGADIKLLLALGYILM